MKSLIPLMYHIASKYKDGEKVTTTEFSFMVITFFPENRMINIIGNYEINCYPYTKTINLRKIDYNNERRPLPFRISLITHVRYIKLSKNLFKHKIQFHSQREDLSFFPKINNDAALTATYSSELIDNPEEKGIKNYGDIVNGIEPYLYYLASKYQNFMEWVVNDIRFSIYVY